jgi:hypothetical protein
MNKVGKVHGMHAVNADQQHMTYGKSGGLLRMSSVRRNNKSPNYQNESECDAYLS